MNDFGKIAVSVRVAHSPDPMFLCSWTRLITAGLRPGDTTISPAIELPHHHAANVIVHKFLKYTDADTLLMLDDDMSFPGDALSQMRDNEHNHPFDVVQALCVSRQPPHAPIVLMESKEEGMLQPMKPDADDNTLSVIMVGMAFTLIRREVFETLDTTQPFMWCEDGRGEDWYFCDKAKQAGFNIGMDSNLPIGHRVRIAISYDKHADQTQYDAHMDRSLIAVLNGE